MKNKKYELLTDDTIELFGRTLYRIRAKIDFGIVEKGQLGGYIEKVENLSENGNAWVYGNAVVYGNARVCDNAWVYGNAVVYGDAWVYGNARVCDDAVVYGDARVCGNARVCDNAVVYGDAVVSSSKDYNVFKNTWSSFRWFTYTKSNKMWKVGCFYGTGAELIAKAYKDSELSGKCYEAYVNLVSDLEKISE